MEAPFWVNNSTPDISDHAKKRQNTSQLFLQVSLDILVDYWHHVVRLQPRPVERKPGTSETAAFKIPILKEISNTLVELQLNLRFYFS